MLYFITESYLKTNTPITANVDVTDVTPYIATQAALRVQPILGTTFSWTIAIESTRWFEKFLPRAYLQKDGLFTPNR